MRSNIIVAIFSAALAWAASAAEDGAPSKPPIPSGVIIALGDAIQADVPAIVVGAPQVITFPYAGSSKQERMVYIAHEAFGLFPIEIVKTLTGKIASGVIFVQRPDAKGLFVNGWGGDLASDGVPRLLFLSPARNLVDYSRAKPMAAFKEFATIKGICLSR